MTLNKAYEILERYYLYLDYSFYGSNIVGFDIDSAYTKAELEKVLNEQPKLSKRGSEFLQELLSDDMGETVAGAIHTILNENL